MLRVSSALLLIAAASFASFSQSSCNLAELGRVVNIKESRVEIDREMHTVEAGPARYYIGNSTVPFHADSDLLIGLERHADEQTLDLALANFRERILQDSMMQQVSVIKTVALEGIAGKGQILSTRFKGKPSGVIGVWISIDDSVELFRVHLFENLPNAKTLVEDVFVSMVPACSGASIES